MEAGLNCEEQFDHCSLNQFAKFPCCSRLLPIFDRFSGRCHLFEGKSFNQTQSGGLSVVMKMNRNIGVHQNNRPGTVMGAAVKIQHEYDPNDNQLVFIPPGHIATISLQVSLLSGCNAQECDASEQTKLHILKI